MANVLIVDDDPASRRGLAIRLGAVGHQTTAAADGASALAQACQSGPDLVIAGIVLPDMDGDEFVRQLHHFPRLAAVPVIFQCPACLAEAARQLGRICGVEQVLPKPADLALVERTVQAALQQAPGPLTPPPSPEFEREHRRAVTSALLRRMHELETANGELQRALNQAEETYEQQIERERLGALGQMAGGVAHDFNNALGPILGFSELLLRHPVKLKERETLTSLVRMINTSAKDAAAVVRSLREFYRPREKGEVFLPVNLNQLIEQVAATMQPRWQQQARTLGVPIEVRTVLGGTQPVYGNESELREAVGNLLANAVAAIPQGGTVTVRTKSLATEMLLEVSDTGPGLTAEARRRCFEPFYRANPHGDKGLGLAIVHGIVERHGGRIEVQSQTGQGTTFAIRLPIRPHQLTNPGIDEPSAAARPLHVLLVDDEAIVANIISLYLTSDGHTVEQVSDGPHALEKFQDGVFDLVITDRSMPGMSGEQLAALLKQHQPRLPIILLTGLDVHGTRPPGVDCVLGKPVTIDEMRKAIGDVVAA
jgi:signal transduction histidine kinase